MLFLKKERRFRRVLALFAALTIGAFAAVTALLVLRIGETAREDADRELRAKARALDDAIVRMRNDAGLFISDAYVDPYLFSDFSYALKGDFTGYYQNRIATWVDLGSPILDVGDRLAALGSRFSDLVSISVRGSKGRYELRVDAKRFSVAGSDSSISFQIPLIREERIGIGGGGSGAKPIGPRFIVEVPVRGVSRLGMDILVELGFDLAPYLPKDEGVVVETEGKVAWASRGAPPKDALRQETSPVPGCTVTLWEPGSEVSSRVGRQQTAIALVGALGIALAAAFGLTVMRFFTTRIHEISEGMAELETGNFRARIRDDEGDDELSGIARTFNQTCDRLESYVNRVYKLEITQREAEIQALQAKVNPHFLYNTLEAIRMKAISSGSREAGEMIVCLARFLRYGVSGGRIVELRTEIGQCLAYLDLFRIRHLDRIEVASSLPEALERQAMPKLSLQPLVENCIIHGFSSGQDGFRVSISAEERDGFALVAVEDNGSGISDESLAALEGEIREAVDEETQALGLANVHERLRLMFGEGSGLRAMRREGGGTRVELRIKREDCDVRSAAGG
jgi:Predicted signal transduction protein with a C-terminal ATPase domain